MGNTQKLGNYVNAIFQDASNNVGIGAAPSGSYKLEVTGTAKVSGATYLASSGAANVGIGTTTANAALDIAVDAAVLNYPRIYDSRTQAIDRGGKLSLGGYSDSLTTITSFGQIVGAKTNATSGNTSGYLSFLTNSGSGLVESLRLASTGVATFSGFGSNSFSSGGTGYNKLTIRNTTAGVANGSQLSIGTDADADQFYVQSFATTFTTSGMNIAGGAVINGEGPGGLSIAATQSSIGFYTNGAAAGNLRMTITSAGNVGIGTSSPDFPLTVKTDASANSIKILGRSSGDTSISWNSADNLTQYAHIDIGASYSQLYSNSNFQIFASTNQATGGAYNTFGNLYVASTSGQGTNIGGSISIGGKFNGAGAYATFARIQGKKENSSSGQTGGYLAFETCTDVTNNLTERMRIESNGYISMPAIYGSFTTSSAANMYMYTDGGIYRSTSSIKYKNNVQDYTKGLTDVLKLRPVTYEGKSEMDKGKTFAGLIAEEVHEIGLTEFVQYAEDGTPDALAYANMVALLVKAIQELNERLNKAGL